jgi:hypothetical protein
MPATRRLTDKVRRLLLESGNAALDRTVYLYHHFAASGFSAGSRVVAVPHGDGRLACYEFGIWVGTWPTHLGRIYDGCAATVLAHNDASVSNTGTWATASQSLAYGGSYSQGGASGNTGTKTATVTGTRIVVTGICLSNGGTAIVSLDGSETAATLLPAVTQADINGGAFAQSDLGKRYIDCFKAGTGYYDQHFPIAEGLANTTHTIIVRCTGLKRTASTDSRIYITGFCAGGPSTKPTDSGARIAFLRDVVNPRMGFSAMGVVVSYTPTGFSNPQFLSESHQAGSVTETVATETWYVDGVSTTTVAGTTYSGAEVVYDRTTTIGHPNAAGCATKRVVHTARADTPLQLTCRGLWQWNTAGTVNGSFFGMLPLCEPVYDNTVRQTQFTRALFLNGDRAAAYAIPTAGADGTIYTAKGDTVAAYSTAHDAVVVLHNARTDLLNEQAIGQTYLADRSDGFDKAYIARVDTLGGTPQSEAVSAGTARPFEFGFRVFQIPGASTRLG